MFTELFPILITSDLRRLTDFYVAATGATITYQYPASGDPGYVALDIGAAHLGIALDAAAAGSDVPQRTALWFYADSCDEATEQFRRAGATITSEPTDMAWGERLATALDLDGNVINIGQAAAP